MISDARETTIWVSTDVRVIARNGKYYSTHSALNDGTLDRCRLPGVRLVLVARVVESWPIEASQLSSMDDVAALHETTGSAVRRLTGIIFQTARLRVRQRDVVVARIPEVVSTLLWLRGTAVGARTIANFVAEASAAIHFFGRRRSSIEKLLERMARLVAKRSSATVYVTRWMLQDRYPPRSALTLSQSNVQLPEGWYDRGPRSFHAREVRRLIAVGQLESNGKGIDILLRAFQLAQREVDDLELVILGDGSLRAELEKLAESLGVDKRVTFVGFVSTREELANWLDQSHLLVMPSRYEGLPRSAVEAQARGLPCLASDVGGLPEVVPPEGIHAAGDYKQLARMIVRTHMDEAYATRLAADGYMTSVAISDAADPELFTDLVASTLTLREHAQGSE